MALHWADWLVFAIFLAASIGIGIYHALTGGRQRTTQEFIMADRNLKVIPTMLSMLVSYQSAIMILGHTSEMYTRSSQAWLWECIAYLLAILLAERIFVPFLYPLKLTSVNEYLTMRYESRAARMLGSTLAIAAAVLYMGVAMFAPSIALEAVTGLPVEASIPIMAVVCITYTALGGMKAVIWTDVMQFVVMFCGIVALLIAGTIKVGGFGKALEVCDRGGRLMWADINPDPTVRHTVWGFLFGWTSTWMFTYGLQQSAVQRYSALPSLRKARMSLLLNIPILLLMVTMVCILGLTTFAYYSEIGCDPLASGRIRTGNQILPLFMLTLFSKIPGVAGLFLATLYSGALSSVSSALSAASANAWEDLLKWKLQHKVTEERATLITKILVVVFGAIATGIAFLAGSIDAPVTQVSLALIGSVSGPKTGMYMLGGLFRIANWKGAVGGTIVGVFFNFWVSIGALTVGGRHNPPLPPASTINCTYNFTMPGPPPPPVTGLSKLYTLSYIYYTLFGTIITIVFGLVISVITRESKEVRDARPERLFVPLNQFFSCNLDESRVDTSTSNAESKQPIPNEKFKENAHDNPAYVPSTQEQLDGSAASEDTTRSSFVPPTVHAETNM